MNQIPDMDNGKAEEHSETDLACDIEGQDVADHLAQRFDPVLVFHLAGGLLGVGSLQKSLYDRGLTLLLPKINSNLLSAENHVTMILFSKEFELKRLATY